ncbi:MAG: hypothetical protein IJS53_05615, partial [Clostridia bacterium]|nr:hypothetical protein [Clostridia bacterium]
RWGTRRLLIYLVIGVLANLLGAFLVYFLEGYAYGVNTYLFHSMIIAFATLYPDAQINLFFILPLKAKWLAVLDLLFFLCTIIFLDPSHRVAAIASLVSVALFFGEDIYQNARRAYFQWQRRREFRKGSRM